MIVFDFPVLCAIVAYRVRGPHGGIHSVGAVADRATFLPSFLVTIAPCPLHAETRGRCCFAKPGEGAARGFSFLPFQPVCSGSYRSQGIPHRYSAPFFATAWLVGQVAGNSLPPDCSHKVAILPKGDLG